MRGRVLISVVATLWCLTGSVDAQLPTGTISGRVAAEGGPMAGVTVTATSPALQGEKTVVTTHSGDYLMRFLPPGEYTVLFNLAGFKQLEARVKVSAAKSTVLDADMIPEEYAGEVTVVGSFETISSATTGAATYESSLIEELPVSRSYTSAVLLAPGTTVGMRGISFSGNLSGENQYMINGVSAMDNIRGTVHPLYIEDAIEEQTIQTSAISAEWGRFSGGVVNMITKSGGNSIHGSYRLSLENDDWVAKTPLTLTRQDQLATIHEITLGGPVWKDHLWFFLAGRDDPGADEAGQTLYTNIPFTTTRAEERMEAKLTLSPHVNHRFTGSYIDRVWEGTDLQTNVPPLDLLAVDDYRREDLNLMAVHYAGVISNNFFIEGQYSRKEYDILDLGRPGLTGDLIRGTGWYDVPLDESMSNIPGWDADRTTDDRHNENYLLKGSLFLSSSRLGSHDIVFGFDSFDDIRDGNNYQSPSDFFVGSLTPGIIDGQNYYPTAFPGASAIMWFPIRYASLGTSFTTNSLFANDTWRLGKKLTLNLGLRYDWNDGQNSDGVTISDSDRWSPRLGATWDVKGDGSWLVHGFFGRYVTTLANGVADTSAAGGRYATFWYIYLGNPINMGGGELLTTREAIAEVFAWFDSVGGVDNSALLINVAIPGVTRGIPDGLKSPYTDEITVGFTTRLGTRGMLRADYVHREAADFYATKIDMTTGQVTDELGQDFDYGEIVNDDSLQERVYDGLHAQFQYRLGARWSLGATWTWSHSRGTWHGEEFLYGPVSSDEHLLYPEYRDPSWAFPRGDLAFDQRHKVRAWAVWNAVSKPRHNLSVSVLQSFSSGVPYGAREYIDVAPYVDNPGYVNPTTVRSYYFTPRDAFRTDDISATNLAVNYGFTIPAFGTSLDLYIQPEIYNLFNQHGEIDQDRIVVINPANPFDPFTETPVEGMHYDFGPEFGQATTEEHFQEPRTFRVSLGFRF